MLLLYRFLYAIARLDYGPVKSHWKVWATIISMWRVFFNYYRVMKAVEQRRKDEQILEHANENY